jgi:pyrimidine-specific ribonucleoside hydrolase
MTVKKLLAYILAIIICSGLHAHSGKARYHVIVETDGGKGDLRAISLLLASKQIEVIGIYCPEDLSNKLVAESEIRTMLKAYHNEGVPVGLSEDFLKKLYLNEGEKITYIQLGGSGSGIKYLSTDQEYDQKIEQIISLAKDVKFTQNSSDEEYLIASTSPIPFIPLASEDGNIVLMDTQFLSKAADIKSRYSELLDDGLQNTAIVEELTALYLHNPSIFMKKAESNNHGDSIYVPYSSDSVCSAYLEMLKEKEPDYKIFKDLSYDPRHYQEDIGPYILPVRQSHGESEWRAGVLCFELHGHIGIYAIIGVKMGLRARDYFNIGLDDLHIESNAGLIPPISCLNDGLQVSTGSSLGHGLIEAIDTDNPEISAAFSFKDSKILISLDTNTSARLREDIQRCIREYGKLTPSYWEAIRALALEYWLQLDRNQIFTIKKV